MISQKSITAVFTAKVNSMCDLQISFNAEAALFSFWDAHHSLFNSVWNQYDQGCLDICWQFNARLFVTL